MTLAATEHPQRIMQRRDFEHAVQAGAGQHFVDETRWVHQFELDSVVARPVMQRHQGVQSPAIHELQLREIQHHDPRGLFRYYRVPKGGHLGAAHQSPSAVHNRHIAGFFNVDR